MTFAVASTTPAERPVDPSARDRPSTAFIAVAPSSPSPARRPRPPAPGGFRKRTAGCPQAQDPLGTRCSGMVSSRRACWPGRGVGAAPTRSCQKRGGHREGRDGHSEAFPPPVALTVAVVLGQVGGQSRLCLFAPASLFEGREGEGVEGCPRGSGSGGVGGGGGGWAHPGRGSCSRAARVSPAPSRPA